VLSDFLDEQDVDHDFRKPLHNNSVTELKPYQEKCLDIWANHWTNIGLCTRPTDEIKAEQYFYNLYKKLGFVNIESVVWFDNPIEMYGEISNWANNKILHKVNDQIWASNKISYKVNAQMLKQARNKIINRTLNKAWDKIYNFIWNRTSDRRWNQTSNTLWNQLFHGQNDAESLVFEAYCMQVLRMESPKPLVPRMLLAQEVNWWFPTEKTVYVTRKPKEFIVKNNELINIVYQDGFILKKEILSSI
jgi:hypothetical protein